MNKLKIQNSMFVFWFFIFMIFPTLLFACPFCKEAISKMGEIWTSVGFNWSIYLMIAVPFLLVASFAAALYWNCKKKEFTNVK